MPTVIYLGYLSLRVRANSTEHVGVALDCEVEPPVVVDARLPDAARLVVFLCAKRGMLEVPKQMGELFPKEFVDLGRRCDQFASEAFSEDGAHVSGA